jgi:hypothetical protein
VLPVDDRHPDWRGDMARAKVTGGRIMKSLFTTLILLICSALACPVSASWQPLTMAELVQKSDAIAIVTITKTEFTEVVKSAKGMSRQLAFAHVEQSLKGVTNGASIRLPFDRDMAPVDSDPHYAKGERCLLFLRQVSPSTYTVIQSAFDKHLIKGDQVKVTDGQHGIQSVPLKDIVNQIKSLLSVKK